MKTFIQDRKKTDAKTDEGSRYVLTRTHNNGDVENLAYSDNAESIKNLARERNLELEKTSNGWNCYPYKWAREVQNHKIEAYKTHNGFEVMLNDVVIIDRTDKNSAQHLLKSIEKGLMNQ